MKMRNSKDVEQLIEVLDYQIHAGYVFSVEIKTKYRETRDSANFDMDKFLAEYENILGKWRLRVIEILHTELGATSHFLYHFVRSLPISFVFDDMPRELSNLITRFNNHLEALENIIMRLEEREGLLIRQEIAKLERDKSIKYELQYSKNRELTLNSLSLARPDFMSENDQFLTFIFEKGNAWRNIPVKELLEYMKTEKLNKKLHQILSDVGIVDDIKSIFIPNISTKGFEFRNPITYGFFEEHRLPEISFKKPVRSNKK